MIIMLHPVYYAILKTLGIINNEEGEEDESIPWYTRITTQMLCRD